MTSDSNGQAAGAPARSARFLTVSLARELGILLSLSVMFPFMIHILPVPQDSRLGARLLPMFYAPLLAALVGRPATALGVALLAPWLNWALTSHPSPSGAIVLTLQLVVFVVAMRAMLARVAPHWFLVVSAFLLCIAASALAAAVFPAAIGGREPLAWALQNVSTGLPGLGVLLLINWLVHRYYTTGGQGGGPGFA